MTAQDAIHALWTASIATPIDLKTNGARDLAVALKLSTGVVTSLLGNSRNSSVREYEQRSDHCDNRRDVNGAHDVRPYSHNPHGNIFVAINPGSRRANNQGD